MKRIPSDFRRLSGAQSRNRTSDTRIFNPDSFKRLMAHFEAMGFRSTAMKKDMHRKTGKASEAQMRKISQLWGEFTDGTGTDTSLRHWMEKRGYGSSVTWLESDIARKVIAALMNMVDRKQVKGARHGCS